MNCLSFGATKIQAKRENITAQGATNNQPIPYEYACPANPIKLFVLEYVAKNDIPITIPPSDLPPMK